MRQTYKSKMLMEILGAVEPRHAGGGYCVDCGFNILISPPKHREGCAGYKRVADVVEIFGRYSVGRKRGE